jgi:cell division protein ZapE
LLEENTEVINVDGGKDYRINKVDLKQYYYSPFEGERSFMQAHFDSLRNNEPLLDKHFKLNGRDMSAIARTSKVIWFDFKALCEGPRGQADYIELAKHYQAIMLSHVPQFDLNKDNEARRFIGLVDELYDNKIKLIMSAEASIEELYKGTRLEFEFKRTISRLQEMQSQQYWNQKGIPARS